MARKISVFVYGPSHFEMKDDLDQAVIYKDGQFKSLLKGDDDWVEAAMTVDMKDAWIWASEVLGVV